MTSLVEGDEQPDQPNSQTCMKCCCLACAEEFLGFIINTIAYFWANININVLLLKSSIGEH